LRFDDQGRASDLDGESVGTGALEASLRRILLGRALKSRDHVPKYRYSNLNQSLTFCRRLTFSLRLRHCPRCPFCLNGIHTLKRGEGRSRRRVLGKITQDSENASDRWATSLNLPKRRHDN
jgi:hypothetical protein